MRDKALLDQFSRLVCYPYLALAHRFRWHGAENVPRTGPAVIVANHQSYYDPVLLSLAADRRIYYLALRQYFGYPLLGFLMRRYGAVAVGSGGPEPSVFRSLSDALQEGRLCGIFPEGGRSPDGLPRAPRPGAAALAVRTGVPVVPATICGAFRAWPVGRRLPRPAPIELIFQEPMVMPGRGASRRMRREMGWQIMLRIADGFRLLGRPQMARAARDRLLSLRRGDVKKL